MNKLVKRGFSAYKIFLKNKIASSIMMLFAGVMMFIAALNGKGNDTKSLPILITSLGTILSLWAESLLIAEAFSSASLPLFCHLGRNVRPRKYVKEM